MDTGITSLRWVFLNRAVDLAVREVRLGNVSQSERFSDLICQRTAMLPKCRTGITVEMQPVDTTNFTGLDAPTRCIDREHDITPAVTFNPGAEGAQELMLVRVCVASDPFIRFTGFVSGLRLNQSGQYVLTSQSIFVNEPE